MMPASDSLTMGNPSVMLAISMLSRPGGVAMVNSKVPLLVERVKTARGMMTVSTCDACRGAQNYAQV